MQSNVITLHAIYVSVARIDCPQSVKWDDQQLRYISPTVTHRKRSPWLFSGDQLMGPVPVRTGREPNIAENRFNWIKVRRISSYSPLLPRYGLWTRVRSMTAWIRPRGAGKGLGMQRGIRVGHIIYLFIYALRANIVQRIVYGNLYRFHIYPSPPVVLKYSTLFK